MASQVLKVFHLPRPLDYISPEEARCQGCSRMVLRYCPDSVLIPRVHASGRKLIRTNGATIKDTHKVPRQDSHPFSLTKDCFVFVERRFEMSRMVTVKI